MCILILKHVEFVFCFVCFASHLGLKFMASCICMHVCKTSWPLLVCFAIIDCFFKCKCCLNQTYASNQHECVLVTWPTVRVQGMERRNTGKTRNPLLQRQQVKWVGTSMHIHWNVYAEKSNMKTNIRKSQLLNCDILTLQSLKLALLVVNKPSAYEIAVSLKNYTSTIRQWNPWLIWPLEPRLSLALHTMS